MAATVVERILLERGRWLLGHIASAGADVGLDELEANFVRRGEGEPRQLFAMLAGRIGAEFAVDEEVVDGLGAVHFLITSENGRRWDLAIEFEPEASRKIWNVRLQRRLPDGVEIRDATPEDGRALAALYAATPMQAGDMRVTIDAGDDYFALTRLMEHARTLAAFEHGEAIGLYTGTLFPGSLRGEEVEIALGCHNRISDGKAGGGVWSTMNTRMLDGFDGKFDIPVVFVLTGNTAARRLTSDGAWPSAPVRAVIPCDPQAARVGRPATPDDAAKIAEVLNATHGSHDLYRRRTPEAVARRLERAPDLYSWDDVWLFGDAVVGVGRTLQRRTTETPSGSDVSVRALVFDYGALPGSEDALVRLLHARGANAARRGASHLSIFTCDASRLYEPLISLASTTEIYDLLMPGVAPDDDAAARGVFVDQIHF